MRKRCRAATPTPTWPRSTPPGISLRDYAQQIESHGIKTERLSDSQPNIAEAVAFHDPKGTRIEAFVEATPASAGFQRTGIVPNKLGHVAFSARDVKAGVDFYCNVLGFKVSDWMGDFFAFLRCGPYHHTVNLIAGAADKMHHIAQEFPQKGKVWDDIGFAASMWGVPPPEGFLD